MFLELNREEVADLIRLVEERIRRERFSASDHETDRESEKVGTCFDRDRDRECWDRILHKLHGCECDVLA